MTLREQFAQLVPGHVPVFGEPHRTDTGVTVITVTSPGGWLRPDRPLGILVIADGEPTFVPTADDTRVARLGIAVGLVAATFGAAAVLRRPPWPDLSAKGLAALHSCDS
ncbi:hypothetical protein [Nocardia stercoris]|uniref:Uncharacterized protein n=1 Tax=Nocardia stercoris TaxID=2483361 RepID=A0A3M2L1X1_9NOCA|nr:hypothetical protein [Nocardia stercoris]RMI31692.1 hypothetical protein EBN03_15905 [Nocardia stercoris]